MTTPFMRSSIEMRPPIGTNIFDPWSRQARSLTGSWSVSAARPSFSMPKTMYAVMISLIDAFIEQHHTGFRLEEKCVFRLRFDPVGRFGRQIDGHRRLGLRFDRGGCSRLKGEARREQGRNTGIGDHTQQHPYHHFFASPLVREV